MGASKLNRAVVLGSDLWAVLGADLIGLVCDERLTISLRIKCLGNN